MRNSQRYIILCTLLVCLLPLQTYAQRAGRNQVELGVQGGMTYYVGDAHPRLFQDVREAYGLEFAYMFNRRWSLMVQGTGGRIAGHMADSQGRPDPKAEMWTNQLVSIDAVAKFNFLPYGMSDKYDLKIKPYTPFIYAGIGLTLHNNFSSATAYLPVGVGFRWACSEHVGMFVVWQHNICFGDNLETDPAYNNIHDMNGSNILNCDLVSTIQFGIVFEFAKEKKQCKFCKERY